MRCMPMRYTPMRCTPMRCTPVGCTPMRCTPVRCTPVRCTPMRCASMRCIYCETVRRLMEVENSCVDQIYGGKAAYTYRYTDVVIDRSSCLFCRFSWVLPSRVILVQLNIRACESQTKRGLATTAFSWCVNISYTNGMGTMDVV